MRGIIKIHTRVIFFYTSGWLDDVGMYNIPNDINAQAKQMEMKRANEEKEKLGESLKNYVLTMLA